MEITPSNRPASYGARSASNLEQTPDQRAATQEREAQKKIAESNRKIEDTKLETDAQVETIRNNFNKTSEEENAKLQDILETQRMKGYEAIKELRRNLRNELSNTRRDGERDLSGTKTYYQNQVEGTNSKMARDLDDLRKSYAGQIKQESALAELGVKDIENQHVNQMNHERAISEERLANLTDSTNKEYQRMQEATSEGIQRANARFQERFQGTVQEQQETIGNLENRAGHQVKEIRQNTAQKLAAYSSRQGDPFYKLVDFDARVHDDGEQYIMTATIPEYEQKHVNVALKGNQLVLAGYRRNEEKLELSPGRTKGTASFQSYHEAFPLEMPVDGKQLTRTFDGDQLIVTVPKKKLVYEAKVATPKPERARVQKPQFPENLPHVQEEAPADPDSEPKSSTQTRGSRTLG